MRRGPGPWDSNDGACKGACALAKSHQLCLTLCDPWTVARQALLSMGFSRQECWSGLPFPSQGGLPNPDLQHCRQIYCLSHLGSLSLENMNSSVKIVVF